MFDNVDTAADILDYWPTCGNGSVILTTRDRDTADKLCQHKVDLQGFEGPDGTELLIQINPQILDQPLVRDIVGELGGMPLAICQMGSYIRQTQCTLEQFAAILQSHSERFYSDTASMAGLQYSRTLAACCDLSIGLLSRDSTHLLGIIAFFQTDEVQEQIITEGCQINSRLDYLSNFLDWNDAIRILTKHGLISLTQKSSGRTLRMHRVVKRRAIQILGNAGFSRLQAFQDAVELLHQRFPARPSHGGTMTKDYKECETWLPHVLGLRASLQLSGIPEIDAPSNYLEMLCNCAWYMWERGTEHSFEFSSYALDICDKLLGKDTAQPVESDILTIVAALKMTRWRARRECVSLFQRALRVRERYTTAKLQPSLDEQRMLANSYNNTGVGQLVLEEWDEALPLFEKAFEIKKTLGDETTIPYDFGISLYNICRVQMGQDRFFEARDNAKRAVELVEGHNGRDDFRANQFRFTYADLLVACGDTDEGLRLHEMTLQIRKKAMGSEHNDTGVSHYGLSCLYERLGRLDDAL